MAKHNPIIGNFFLSRDKKQLFHIAAEVNPQYVVVECYEGLKLVSKKIEPVAKLTGFDLYPDMQSAAHAGAL